ncbi:MAG: hypothetical protein V4447_18015 [Pseudomonadota bacterium]
MKIKHRKFKSPGSWISLIVALSFGLASCGGGSTDKEGQTSPKTPTILVQPSNQAVFVGGSASFSVIASADTLLSFQWKRDGLDIVGATSANYTVVNILPTDANSIWSVEVRTPSGRVISEGARLKFTSISLLAGSVWGAGNTDGFGPAARFSFPQGIAVDTAGNVFVADTENHTIRKISTTGIVTTLAGVAGVSGWADGMARSARFNKPHGLVVDGTGTIYVADTDNHAIRKITSSGLVTTLAGRATVEGAMDGIGEAARFSSPYDVTIDSLGNIYVADTSNHTIRKINSMGWVTTLAGTAGVSGSKDGIGLNASFHSPRSVAIDAVGNLYVADAQNYIIRKINTNGNVVTLAGVAGSSFYSDGNSENTRFSFPTSISVDAIGNVYVADSVLEFSHQITTIQPTIRIIRSIDKLTYSMQSDLVQSTFPNNDYIQDVASDVSGNVYLTDTVNHSIRKISTAGHSSTLAGPIGHYDTLDGIGGKASFNAPHDVAADETGNVYVIDDGAIRKISSNGDVITLAGTTGVRGSADGMGAAASFNGPNGIAVDKSGNVYVADRENHTIRKISPAGQVTTLAGRVGVYGSADGLGAAATFYLPGDVTVDVSGNLYVADSQNHSIRKISPAGQVMTLAGTSVAFGSADGIGSAARFYQPSNITVDNNGNLYVTDWNQGVRKITSAGIVTTLAESSSIFGSITADHSGNIYVVDGKLIRKISSTGVITTLAGTQETGGVVLGDLPGRFGDINGVAVDAKNVLYLTTENAVLRIPL